MSRRGMRWPTFALTVALASGCTPRRAEPISDTALPVSATDSLADERPDSTVSSPPDSAIMMLALLPAQSGAALEGVAAALAERAVFAPRIQRWFVARMLDSAVWMDIGRVDGGVGDGETGRAAAGQMLRARSPIQPGMVFWLHAPDGAQRVTVDSLSLRGRRIVAKLTGPSLALTDSLFPVEWRGGNAVVEGRGAATPCGDRDSEPVSAALVRYAESPTDRVSVVRGCFGDFRAIVSIRPREITPESVERIVLVRASGATRSGKLRDLSYPLHDLLISYDINADGRDELFVRSFRPAMETFAVLRMTDSITFTRFASGFTIEKR
jgi:hypothetical protein